MPKIRKIEILNFRGIQCLAWQPSPGINCLVGPGDSCKSTILDAIDLCLGARRFVQFSDADFHQLDANRPIQITVTLGDLGDSHKNLDAYGMFVRGFNVADGKIEDEPGIGLETSLTVNLTVANDLEPAWSLQSDRAAQQGIVKSLSWKDRLLLSPSRIGALADAHLCWKRGSILNRISEERADAAQALIQATREARTAFGNKAQQQLEKTLDVVSTTAKELGINIGANAKALLDVESTSFHDGTVSLHDEAGIPLRSLGIGSTRLLIAGLQRKATKNGDIVLVDELEYGLEPHRICRFLGSLGAKDKQPVLQSFLTTHSPAALRELSGEQLFIVREIGGKHEVIQAGTEDAIQGTIRRFPEAFLAPSVIVCEGASEVGLFRGLDLYRIEQGKTSFAALGVALIDSGGGTPDKALERALTFQALGYRVMVVRDSDLRPTEALENDFLAKGGKVTAWRDTNALEDELFSSLTVQACADMIEYAVHLHDTLVDDHIKSISKNEFSLDGVQKEIVAKALSEKARAYLGKASRTGKNGWFKSITRMETLARDIVAPNLHLAEPGFRDLIEQSFAWIEDGGR